MLYENDLSEGIHSSALDTYLGASGEKGFCRGRTPGDLGVTEAGNLKRVFGSVVRQCACGDVSSLQAEVERAANLIAAMCKRLDPFLRLP